MNGEALSIFKAQLNLFSTDTNTHDGTITINAKLMDHLLSRYATNTAIAKTHKKIRNFKQGLLVLWYFSETACDPTFPCDGV